MLEIIENSIEAIEKDLDNSVFLAEYQRDFPYGVDGMKEKAFGEAMLVVEQNQTKLAHAKALLEKFEQLNKDGVEEYVFEAE